MIIDSPPMKSLLYIMLHNDNLKTFFLFPQKLVFEEIAEVLISDQVESFILNNHVEFRDALRIFNKKTLAFINIDSVLSELEWKEYIKSFREDSHFSGVRFGILSFNNDPGLMDYYLKELKLECGYHILSRRNNAFEKNIRDIVKKYREEEGNRPLRLDFDNKDPVTFEIILKGQKYSGKINALSSSAMSLTMPYDKILQPGMELNKLTLLYRDMKCSLLGTVIGNSKLNKTQFIIKFQKLFEDFHQKTLFNIIFNVLNNRLLEIVK